MNKRIIMRLNKTPGSRREKIKFLKALDLGNAKVTDILPIKTEVWRKNNLTGNYTGPGGVVANDEELNKRSNDRMVIVIQRSKKPH